MRINNKFSLEQLVFLITDEDQVPRMITGILVTPNGLIYQLSSGEEEPVFHYDCEISEEKTVK